jgi:hypothetical protein
MIFFEIFEFLWWFILFFNYFEVLYYFGILNLFSLLKVFWVFLKN